MSLVFSLGIAIRRQTGTSAPAPATRPVNTVLPAITGAARQGQVLTSDTGGWMGNPTSLARQWLRNGVAILGATAASYTLVAADLGSTISLAVTAANAQGSTTATSAATEPVAGSETTPTVVIGMMGQSNLQYVLGSIGPWDNIPAPDRPVITTPNMTFIGPANRADDGLEDEVSAWPVTTDNIAARNVSASVGALSVALDHIMPGTQFALIDLAVVGTGRNTIKTDGADTTRTWTSIEAPVSLARSVVGEIDYIFEFWYANDTANIPNFGGVFSDLYMGQKWDGAPATLGVDGLDHMLWDITADPDERGRGLFARNKTKLIISEPGADASIANINGVRTFGADSRVQTFLDHLQPGQAMGARDGGHPLAGTPDGGIYSLFGWGSSILKATGVLVDWPEITGIETAPDGSYADLIVNLPNGGNLSTINIVEGRATPTYAHYQPVMWVEVTRTGDTDAERLQIVPTTATSYAAKYRGSVVIHDTGTGTAPNRTGRVRITPEVPFVSGDKIDYIKDNERNITTGAERLANREWLNYLIETVPAWRDVTAQYPFPGVAVKPNRGNGWIADVSTPPENALETPVILANTAPIAGTPRESAVFNPTAGEAIFVIAAMNSSGANGLIDNALVSYTIGTPGRAAGTGTALTLLENAKRGRCSLMAFRVDAPVSGDQTVQLGWSSGNGPTSLRIMVLQVPNAEPKHLDLTSLANTGTSTTSRTHSPAVLSAYNGVIYVQSRLGGADSDPITSASDSTLLFEGNTDSPGSSAGCRLMVRWDLPGTAGVQSETFSWTEATGNNRGFAIQVAPKF